MKSRVFAVVGILALVVAALPAGSVVAQPRAPILKIPVDIDPRLKGMPAPNQARIAEPDFAPLGALTTGSQCPGGDGDSLVINISSFDPANPGTQAVTFWNEGVGGGATLWVAWDFLATNYGREDVVTCPMLEYLQTKMDSIVNTDVAYFGQYDWRPEDNSNIDVMIYNIVDESYFDPDYPFYIAGFFWSGINEEFNRNMVFIDTYEWPNRLGPDDSPWRGDDPTRYRPYTYEGTVAHELEHLIHNDIDPNEDSWVDEGLADMAQYFNGFGHDDGHVVYFLAYHRTPLTVWGGGLESYGASYLFQLYLLENFGTKDGDVWEPDWTLHEVAEQGNSIEGVENATGANFNDLFDAWLLANYLDKPGQYTDNGWPIGYNEIDLAPFVSSAYSPWSIRRGITDIYGGASTGNLPTSRYYGGYMSGKVEYPLGEATPYTGMYKLYKGFEPQMGINFRGAAQAGVKPNTGTWEAASGGGNMVTDRMLALIPTIDTSGGGYSLSFATWYDIEPEWDYGFVEVSTDGGTTWFPIPGTITATSVNPNNSTAWKNSLLGSATTSDAVITGNSGGWVSASFPLPDDDDLKIRFSYYTDEATNGQGWFIDDVAVNGFSDGFEAGAGNWNLGGWAWTTGLFDNDWILAYVNPKFDSTNKLVTTSWGYLDGVVNGAYEYITGLLNTRKLNQHAVTIVFANRPGESPFAAGYRILPRKVGVGQ